MAVRREGCHAYTLKIKFRSTLGPDTPEIQAIVKGVKYVNQATDPHDLFVRYLTSMDAEVRMLMAHSGIEPTVASIEYEGPFHKRKRKR